MTKLQKNINLIKNLEKSYSVEEFFHISDFISSTVEQIDKGLSSIENKDTLKDDVMTAAFRLMETNVYLSQGGLNVLNTRYFNHVVKTIDNLAQQLYKHFDDRHIADRLNFSLKGK